MRSLRPPNQLAFQSWSFPQSWLSSNRHCLPQSHPLGHVHVCLSWAWLWPAPHSHVWSGILGHFLEPSFGCSLITISHWQVDSLPCLREQLKRRNKLLTILCRRYTKHSLFFNFLLRLLSVVTRWVQLLPSSFVNFAPHSSTMRCMSSINQTLFIKTMTAYLYWRLMDSIPCENPGILPLALITKLFMLSASLSTGVLGAISVWRRIFSWTISNQNSTMKTTKLENHRSEYPEKMMETKPVGKSMALLNYRRLWNDRTNSMTQQITHKETRYMLKPVASNQYLIAVLGFVSENIAQWCTNF